MRATLPNLLHPRQKTPRPTQCRVCKTYRARYPTIIMNKITPPANTNQDLNNLSMTALRHGGLKPRSDAIHDLLAAPTLWRASHHQSSLDHQTVLPSGYRQLDKVLPNNGWPTEGVTELLIRQFGIGELQILLPALANLSQRRPHWIVWISPPHLPYAPALYAAGLRLDRILIIQPKTAKEALWSAEQCLKSQACGAVLMWPEKNIRPQAVRRLQVASKTNQTWQVLFRDLNAQQMPSPAPLRIALTPGKHSQSKQPHQHQICVEVVKRAGGWASPAFDLTLPLASSSTAFKPITSIIAAHPTVPAASSPALTSVIAPHIDQPLEPFPNAVIPQDTVHAHNPLA